MPAILPATGSRTDKHSASCDARVGGCLLGIFSLHASLLDHQAPFLGSHLRYSLNSRAPKADQKDIGELLQVISRKFPREHAI